VQTPGACVIGRAGLRSLLGGHLEAGVNHPRARSHATVASEVAIALLKREVPAQTGFSTPFLDMSVCLPAGDQTVTKRRTGPGVVSGRARLYGLLRRLWISMAYGRSPGLPHALEQAQLPLFPFSRSDL